MEITEVTQEVLGQAAANNKSIEVNIGLNLYDIIENGGDIDSFNDFIEYRVIGDNSGYILEDIECIPISVVSEIIYVNVLAYPVQIA